MMHDASCSILWADVPISFAFICYAESLCLQLFRSRVGFDLRPKAQMPVVLSVRTCGGGCSQPEVVRFGSFPLTLEPELRLEMGRGDQ